MIRRATVNTWAKYFEKHEGVRVSGETIRRKLRVGGKIGETARNKVGSLLRGAYFSEQDVRSACADLLRPMAQANEFSFIVLDSFRYGTVFAWSEELGLSTATIKSRLNSANAIPIKGKNNQGNLRDFYPEPAVRAACADLLRPMPEGDGAGFVMVNGVRHGTMNAWALELSIPKTSVFRHLTLATMVTVRGKDSKGKPCNFYPEPAVRAACVDLDPHMLKTDKSGFLDLAGVRHGTAFAWSRELGISQQPVANRINSVKSAIDEKGPDGRKRKFYPEPAVREACADLLRPMPQADGKGFFSLDGIRHASISVWARELGIHPNTIAKRLGALPSVEGRDSAGSVRDFYPKPAVRAACADLLAKKKKP